MLLKIRHKMNKNTNLEALSFLIVLALPKASNNVPACTNLSFVSLTTGSQPETRTTNCNTILAASVLPEPLSPVITMH